MNRRARTVAPAKINLRLRVLGRRADGYHDIDTLFQAIDLADDVEVHLVGDGIRLDADATALGDVDLGPIEQNLAFRAAAHLATALGYDGGVEIQLTKRIPVGAGLGGGSSDGAAVLACLATLLDVPQTDAGVGAIAAALGSDVPFFLGRSPLARGTGRGELIEPVRPLPATDLVLVSPPVHVSTAGAYAALESGRGSGEEGPRPEMIRGWDDVAAIAHNDFQTVIGRAQPEVARALDAVRGAGSLFTLMSGSGSSVYGRFSSRAEAERAAQVLAADLGWPCRAVRTLEIMPHPRIS